MSEDTLEIHSMLLCVQIHNYLSLKFCIVPVVSSNFSPFLSDVSCLLVNRWGKGGPVFLTSKHTAVSKQIAIID